MRYLLFIFLITNLSPLQGQDYLTISQTESFESATLKLIKLGFEHKNSILNNNYNYLRRSDNSRGITELAIMINLNEVKLGNELYVFSLIDEGYNKEYFFDKMSNELKSKFGVSKQFKDREYIHFDKGISFLQYEDKRDNYKEKKLLYLLSLPNPGLSKISHMGSRNAIDIMISEILLFENSNFQRGFKLLQEKKYYECVRLFSGSIDIIDNRMYSYIFRGWAKGMLEDKYGAMEDLNKAYLLMKTVEKKENADLYYYKGLVHAMRGENIDGCKCLSMAGELGKKEAYGVIKDLCN